MPPSIDQPVTPELIAAWRSRQAALRKRLDEHVEDQWAWLWWVRHQIVSYLLSRYAGDSPPQVQRPEPAGVRPPPLPVINYAPREDADVGAYSPLPAPAAPHVPSGMGRSPRTGRNFAGALATIAAAKQGKPQFEAEARRQMFAQRIDDWKQWIVESKRQWMQLAERGMFQPIPEGYAAWPDLLDRVWGRFLAANERARQAEIEAERDYLAHMHQHTAMGASPEESTYRYQLAVWARHEADRVESTDWEKARQLRWVHAGALDIQRLFDPHELQRVEKLLDEARSLDAANNSLNDDEAVSILME